jgi:hypothetical protein
LRVWGLTDEARTEAVQKLKNKLGLDYDIVDEVDHIHIEFDPK